MKKLAVVTVLLSLSLSVVLPVSAQSRPRRVPEQQPSTANQLPAQADIYDPARQSPQRPTAPPVLKGGDGRPVTGPPVPGSQTAEQPAVPSGPEEVDPDEVIRVDTSLITLPVSVTDRDGKYIPNLKQKDFQIYEDGVLQEVAYFAPVEQPFTVALVLDMSGSTKNYLTEIQDAAIAFVDQLRASDRVMIVSFDDDVHVLAEPTSDRRTLRNAIQSSRPGGGTSLYEAVDFVLNRRFNQISGRKAMVLFTDGVDTTSRSASYQGNVMDAEEDGALCYVLQYDTFGDVNARAGGIPSGGGSAVLIDIFGAILGDNTYGRHRRTQGGGAGTSPADYARGDAYLHAMADKTGARVEKAESIADLDRSFAVIADELRRQYSLGYYPKNASNPGQRHSIRVRVMRPNLAVKARSTYITGEPGAGKNPTTRVAEAPVLRGP